MNVNTTLEALFVHHQRLEYLANQLEQNGYRMAAEELKRENSRLSARLITLDAVLDDYKIDIAAAQQLPENPPRFIGVDMGKPEGDRTCFNEVKR